MRETQLSAVRKGQTRTAHWGQETISAVWDLALPPNAQPDRENIWQCLLL